MRLLMIFAIAVSIVGVDSRPMEAQAPLMPPPVIDVYAEAPGTLVTQAEETQAIGRVTPDGSALMAGTSPWAEPLSPALFHSSQRGWQRGALIGAGVGAAAGLVGALFVSQAVRKAVGGDGNPSAIFGATVTGAAVGAVVGAGIGWLAADR